MGETPLYQAVEMDNITQVKILLEYGSNPNAAKSDGNTPLHCAIMKRNAEIIHELLSKGSDPNKQNKLYKQTPFHLLIKNEDNDTKTKYDIAMLLYEFNASPFIKDKYDKTPLDYTDDENMYNIFLRQEKNCHSIMKEIDDNQNNISIISKGELFIENMMAHCNTDAYQIQAGVEKFITNDTNPSQNTIESIKLEQRPKRIQEFNILSNPIQHNSPCRNKEVNFNERISPITRQITIEDQSISRDVSGINPMDYINQMVTTTNGSAIFSELQENRMSSDCPVSHSHKPSKSSNVNEFNGEDGHIMTTPEKMNFDSLDNLSYSKSKSIIVSDLPAQPSSTKKGDHSDHSITYFTVKKLKPEENAVYPQDSLNKDNDSHNKAALDQKFKGKGSSSALNVINLSEKFKEIKHNDNQIAKENALFIEDNVNELDNNSDINTQDLSQNNHSSVHNINSNTNTIVYNSSSLTNHNNNNGNNRNSSRLNTVNSTLPQTQNNNRPSVNRTRPTVHYNMLQQEQQQQNTLVEYEDYKNSLWGPSNQSYYHQDTMVLPKNQLKYSIALSTQHNLKQLHKWLCSIDLLCYYNKIIEKNIFDITKFSNGVLKSHAKYSYKDIEDLGIKKPGHIYRLLLKLQSDSMLLNQSVINFLLPNQMIGDARLSQSNSDLFLLKDTCCGCVCTETKLMKNLDLDSWLKFKGLSHLREHFIHNGFESIEYILIQLFSEYQFTEESLVEHMHIYNMSDRRVLLKELQLQKKKISQVLGLKYDHVDYDDMESSCQSCCIF